MLVTLSHRTNKFSASQAVSGWGGLALGLRSTNKSPGEGSILLLSPGPGGNKQPLSMSFSFLAYEENQATNSRVDPNASNKAK